MQAQVQEVLHWLEQHGSEQGRADMARYGIPAERAYGVGVGSLQKFAVSLGRSHALAAALWDCGGYEPRMLAAFVDVAAEVTAAQMQRWAQDFDNWAICDTVCFKLFDRAPAAWAQLAPWARRDEEFVKRAAFALLWSLSVHDKSAADAQFLQGLRLIEQAAADERHWVKKAVNMALRAWASAMPR